LAFPLFLIRYAQVKDVASEQQDGYPNHHGWKSIDAHAAANRVTFSAVLSRDDALQTQTDTDKANDRVTGSAESDLAHSDFHHRLEVREG
jgi:hypothetical protein